MRGSCERKHAGADLVCGVAVGGDAVRADHHRVHAPRRHQRGRGRVGDERGRDALGDKLVCSQPRPLVVRPACETDTLPLELLMSVAIASLTLNCVEGSDDGSLNQICAETSVKSFRLCCRLGCPNPGRGTHLASATPVTTDAKASARPFSARLAPSLGAERVR